VAKQWGEEILLGIFTISPRTSNSCRRQTKRTQKIFFAPSNRQAKKQQKIMIVDTPNVVITSTDRVSKSLRKPQRRLTAVTTSTASTSALSSMGSLDDDNDTKYSYSRKTAATRKSPSSSGRDDSDVLVRMIAKQMVSSIVAESAGSAKKKSPSKQDLRNLDMDAIAEMVRSTMQKQFSSRHLDQEDDNEDEEEEDFCDYKEEKDNDAATLLTATGTTFTGTTGSSGMSEVSNVTGRQEAPMDIWNPSFWDLSAPDNDTSTRNSGTLGQVSDYENGAEPVDERSRGRMISEFLSDRNNEIVSSDSENDEDCSVLSDISGLTGVFDDHPSERQTKKKTQVVPTRKGDTGSIVGSGHGTLATASTSSKRRKKKKIVRYSVNFGDVEVRRYERIMTDNPASAGGPSIGIGWEYETKSPVNIDDYEVKRSSKKYRSRPSDLVMNRHEREKLIRSLGYTERDIACNVRELNKLRCQRRQTVNNLSAAKMEEAVESVKHQMKKLLFLQRDPKELMERCEL